MKLICFCLAAILAFVSGKTIGVETKLVGGHNAELGQFKYMVSLRSDNQHFCGGSIISSKTVLTSAQCNVGNIMQMTAVIGTINISGGGVSHRVGRFIAHEGYNPEKHQHDIALVILVSDIFFTDVIQPISLPSYDIGDGVSVTVSGWKLASDPGTATNYLQYLNVRTISRIACQNANPDITVFTSQICVSSKTSEGICSGDYGGPIVANNQVHGVASVSFNCADGLPDFFTRVNSYKSWIKQNMV